MKIAHRFKAVLLDLDGVITRTARVHFKAWKTTFDDYLKKHGAGDQAPFTKQDYSEYVDGKPRYDGVQSFLKSRSIDLPWGNPSDPLTAETICGIGNRKNEEFHRLLKRGVDVFRRSVDQVRTWKQEGVALAVVSSSRNCEDILKTAHLESLFDARVDGTDQQSCHLRGKPAPDFFLEAARQLGVSPADAVVVEDAVSGVQAGRNGGFGLVVGIGGKTRRAPLLDHGADIVVENLQELEKSDAPSRGGGTREQQTFPGDLP